MQRRPAGIVSHIQLSSRTAQKRLVAAACEPETDNWTWPLALKSLNNYWKLMPHRPKPFTWIPMVAFSHSFELLQSSGHPSAQRYAKDLCHLLLQRLPEPHACSAHLPNACLNLMEFEGNIWSAFRWKTFAYRLSPSYSFVDPKCHPYFCQNYTASYCRSQCCIDFWESGLAWSCGPTMSNLWIQSAPCLTKACHVK